MFLSSSRKDEDMETKRALLSVFHKTGIVEFAQELANMGWELWASGGTCRHLNEHGVETKDVAQLVGGEAILGHRVVTLSREVHAGLLAKAVKEDQDELDRLGIPRIDLVCVDLYPMADAIAKPDVTPESVLEMTDIGGPTMLRSAAKGRRVVICDPEDRSAVLNWLKDGRPEENDMLRQLGAKVEFVVANYCLQSASFHGEGRYVGLMGQLHSECKYGENAHQQPAALYSSQTDDPLALDKFDLLQGKPGFVNWTDVDRLLQTITHAAAAFEKNRGKVPLLAFGVKHGNPCGGSFSQEPLEALRKMVIGDKRAIFGGVVICNFPIGKDEAEVLLHHEEPKRRNLDGIVAPAFSEEAIDMLVRKSGRGFLLQNPDLSNLGIGSLDQEIRLRPVRGGILAQPNYTYVLDLKHPEMIKKGIADEDTEDDLLLAWAINATSNSNTVTLVYGGKLIGNGVGQQDRVGGCELAIKRARDSGHSTSGAAVVSDSFFPFDDGPTALIKANVDVVLATSGSVNDSQVVQVFEAGGVMSYMIPDKVGRGFFGH